MEISFNDIMTADEVMHKISQMTPKEAFKFGYKYAQREVDKWFMPSAQPEPLTCHGCKHRNEWYEGCKTCIRLHLYKTDNYEEEQT